MFPIMGSGVGPGGRRAYFRCRCQRKTIANENKMEATTHGHVAMVGKSIAEGIERGEDESEKDGE